MDRKISGVGAALVDYLMEAEDSFLSERGVEKGGMNLVEASEIEKMVAEGTSSVVRVPGGSACNTLNGMAKLGCNAEFIGRVGRDETGDFFAQGLNDAGVNARLIKSDHETGRVLSVVTPDAQRSMFTFLGAAAELTVEDLADDIFENTAIVHVEGYLAFNEPVFLRVLELARKNNALVSLDLASFDVVHAKRELLERTLADGVSIVIANEDEAKAYTGCEEKEALMILKDLCETAVVKLGKEGALVGSGSEVVRVSAKKVNAIDTTGAGDLWASGFLHAYARGASLEACAMLGSAVAAEVVQVMGAVIPEKGWEEIYRVKKELSVL